MVDDTKYVVRVVRDENGYVEWESAPTSLRRAKLLESSADIIAARWGEYHAELREVE